MTQDLPCPGVRMSLPMSRFIAAGNWKLHRLCRFQFRFCCLNRELRANGTANCQLEDTNQQAKLKQAIAKGNKLFAKFIVELEQKNKIIAWQIVERCALDASKSQKKPIEIEFRNENQKPETQFQEEPKGKSSLSSPSLHTHKSHLATHHTLLAKTTTATTTHLST